MACEKCQKCDKEEGQAEHTCPYQVGINDDKEFMCNCCVDCEQDCCDAI